MKKSAFVILLMLVLLTTGCGTLGRLGIDPGGRPSPPTISVTVDGVAVPSLQGSYCWRDFSKGVCADTPAPPDLVQAAGLKPAVVAAGSQIHITFVTHPNAKSISLNHWVAGRPRSVLATPEGTFTLPKDPGIYVYEASAAWSQGTASYVFPMEVK